MSTNKTGGWIGVDLDGTLAHYDGWKGSDHIGEPVLPMLNRVKVWLAEGEDVRIFTARVCRILRLADTAEAEAIITVRTIENWCKKYIGQVLPVTCIKDFGMIELWDDRCVQIIANTGARADGCI